MLFSSKVGVRITYSGLVGLWLCTRICTTLRCPPNLQLLRGQDLCSCGHKSVEQFAGRITKRRVAILPVQAVAEDVFIWTVRPRRIVNCSFLTAPCRNICTYLLTYLSFSHCPLCVDCRRTTPSLWRGTCLCTRVPLVCRWNGLQISWWTAEPMTTTKAVRIAGSEILCVIPFRNEIYHASTPPR